jgi:hypothetical protein
VGPLSERDPAFAELLHEPWDRRVRISNLSFAFDPLLESPEAKVDAGNGLSLQRGGMVTGMSLEFGPIAPTNGSGQLHDHISQVLSFKIFDSVGTSAII